MAPNCDVLGSKFTVADSLSIRPSYGARGEEILDGGGGRGRRERKFLSFTSLPFSLPFFPFSPETPDTQAKSRMNWWATLVHFKKIYIFNDVKHPQRKWPANTAVSLLW